MNTTFESSEAAILNRLFRPGTGGWPPAVAEAMLSLGFAESDRSRMSEFLEKAKAGSLTEQESQALENYRHVGRLLELMKSRARGVVAQTAV